jgi:hypothetical protein
MRSCTSLLLTFVLPTSFAHAASIGLFADPNCASCDITIPSGETATIYVMLDATELPPGVTGVTGAEFRIAGLPPSWTAVSAPNPCPTRHRRSNWSCGCADRFRVSAGWPMRAALLD